MKIKARYLALLFVVSILIIIYYGLNFESNILKYFCALLVLLETFYITYMIRNNKCGFIMMLIISYELYSIIACRYLGYKTTDSILIRYEANITEYVYGVSICILLIWITLFLVLICSNKYAINNNVTARIMGNTNEFIGSLCVFATIIILIMKFDFSVLGTKQRGGVSAAFEYAIIFFAFGYYYAANNKLIRYALNFVLTIYSIVALLAGERIGVVQMIFVPFLLYYGMKISNKWIIILIMGGIVGMSVISDYRTSFFGKEFSINNAITALLNNKFAFDGADHGFYTSLTMVLMSMKDDFGYRLTQGINYLFCIFLGDNSWLQRYTYQYYPHTFGGFVPYIVYYYYGWLGVILSSMSIGIILLKANKIVSTKKLTKRTDYYGLLLIILTSTTFRWFGYSYILLFRMLFFYTIIFIVFNYFDRFKINIGKSNEK